jgi:hypothetical protein
LPWSTWATIATFRISERMGIDIAMVRVRYEIE